MFPSFVVLNLIGRALDTFPTCVGMVRDHLRETQGAGNSGAGPSINFFLRSNHSGTGPNFEPLLPSRASGTTLRQAQGPPFDKLRDHPSRASGTTLRQAQGPPFDKLRDHPSTSSGTALRLAQGAGEVWNLLLQPINQLFLDLHHVLQVGNNALKRLDLAF